jgi:hypothetical protein
VLILEEAYQAYRKLTGKKYDSHDFRQIPGKIMDHGKNLSDAGIGMSTILNAILVWADTPGIEILEMTDSYIQIDSPKGTATVTFKEDTYDVVSPSEQLKAKIEEIIETALAEEKALWKRGHEFYTGGLDV